MQSDRYISIEFLSFLKKKKKGAAVFAGGGNVFARAKANEEKTRQGRVKLYLDDEVEDLEAPS